MISVFCFSCRKELIEPGAIVLSPPIEVDKVCKYHLCLTCWKRVEGLLRDHIGEANEMVPGSTYEQDYERETGDKRPPLLRGASDNFDPKEVLAFFAWHKRLLAWLNRSR